MMLNKMFMFHCQLNQNIGCKVKCVVNMNRQIVVIVIEVSSLFSCPEFTPWLPCLWCWDNFWRVTPSLPWSKRLI